MAGRAHVGQEPCLVLHEAQGDQGAPELIQDHWGRWGAALPRNLPGRNPQRKTMLGKECSEWTTRSLGKMGLSVPDILVTGGRHRHALGVST